MIYSRLSYKDKFYLSCSLIYIFIQVYIIKVFPAKIGCDAFAYFNIAKKYSHGHFSEAINAYWSPLISWLSVPFFFFDDHCIESIRIINIFSGLLILYLTVLVLRNRYKVSNQAEVIGFLTIYIFSVAYSLDSNTPDFLLIACLMGYLYFISSPLLYVKKRISLFVLLSALATVFCKGFYMYYIVAHLLLFSIWKFYSLPNKKTVLIHSSILFFAIVLFLGTWIMFMSIKYDKFIINSAGSYNSNLITPQGFIIPHYNNTAGLLPPPDQYAVCSWEDPTYYPLKARNPFASLESFKYQLDIYKYNFNLLIYMLRYYSFFGVFLIPILASFFFIKNKNNTVVNINFFTTSSMLVIIGYFLILMEERHLLPAMFILIITTISIFDYSLNRFIKNGYMKILVTVLVALMFLKNTVLIFSMWNQRQIEHLANKASYERMEQRLAPLIRGKKLAGYYDASVDIYMISLAYRFDAKYYGQLGIHHNDQENDLDLKSNDIDYLFYLGCQKKDPDKKKCLEKNLPFYLVGKKVISNEDGIEMSVYSMKDI